ncbi:hypothetical protein L1887_42621 [Cichorium endivia]|nr:hypothetical protein L1887_42621 [Cichorium endivia]
MRSERLDASLLTVLEVLADEHLGSLPELDAVDDLLGCADGEGDCADDLWPAEERRLLDDVRDPGRGTEGARAEEEEGLDVEAEGSLVKVHEVEADEEELVACAEHEERPAVVVVVPEDLGDVRGDDLVRCGAGDERAVHVDVVRAEVERDEALEDDGAAWVGGGEEAEQTGGGAAVGDHVEHGTKLGRLSERPRSHAVKGVEQARDAVEERADLGVALHKVEREGGEDDTGVSYQIGDEEEDVLVRLVGPLDERLGLAVGGSVGSRHIGCCGFGVASVPRHIGGRRVKPVGYGYTV